MSPNMVENLKVLCAQIDKKYGKGSVMSFADKAPFNPDDVISSGSIGLDMALGIGGYKKGRIIEIVGEASAGKTTLCLHAIHEVQQQGKKCLFVDAEHALDIRYAKSLGVDVDDMLICQPDYGEQALDIVDMFVRSGEVGLIVVDSVAALIPKKELEGEVGDQVIGLQARIMSQAMRKIAGVCAKTSTTVIFTNQYRCLPVNSYVICNNKLTYLKDVKVGDELIYKTNLTTKVKNIHSSGIVHGKKLHIKHRGDFCLSNNHLQPILHNGTYKELYGNEIQINDWIIQPIIDSNILTDNKHYIGISNIVSLINEKYRENTRCKKVKLPSVIDEDLAFVLGCYYSDGSLISAHKSTKRISFTENNTERFNLIKNIVKKIFDKSCIKISSEHSYINLGGSYIYDFFKILGCLQYGKNKTIPELIINSKLSVIKSFIRGAFFDTHRFDQQGFIFSNENNKSIKSFVAIFNAIGIYPNIIKPKIKQKNYYLIFSGRDAVKFNKLIGFAEPTKQKLAQNFNNTNSARGKYDVIPYELGKIIFETIKKEKIKKISSFSYYRSYKQCLLKKLNLSRKGIINFIEQCNNKNLTSIKEFLTNNRFSKIYKIEDTEFNAIDIETENGLFVANGILTHNSNIGVMWGSNKVVSGGKALAFYASQRLDIARIGDLKVRDEIVGNKTRVKVIKNKLAPPKKEAEFTIRFGTGVDKNQEILDLAIMDGIIKRSGAWFKHEDQTIAQGEANALEWLIENPDIKENIFKEIRENRGIDIPEQTTEEESNEQS